MLNFQTLKLKRKVIVLFFLGFVILIFFIFKSDFPQQTTIKESELINQFSPLQKAIINKTTVQEIEKELDIQKKEILQNGNIQYSLTSPIIQRPNEIIVKDNKAIFERILIPEKPTEEGYVKISEYTKRYGPPDEIIKGSKFYGSIVETYIYAGKGFSFIGNSNTDEIYEIHLFPPTSVEDYINTFGDDINKTTETEKL